MFSGIAHAMGAPDPNASMSTQLLNSFVPIIAIIAIFYLMLIRPQQKKNKNHQAMQKNLKRGDRVITNGGFFGRIVEINAEEAIVDLGETKVTIARAALNAMPENSPAQENTGKEGRKGKEKK